MEKLQGKKVAMLVADGFEQIEMTSPRKALEAEGAVTHLISPNAEAVTGWHHFEKGDKFDIDITLKRANPSDYDALVLPGGVVNPDSLRIDEDALNFIRAFARDGKPIGAICHGPWTLINIDFVKGKTMTSWPSLKKDLQNAGANWVDEEVVVDNGLVTSRKPDDLEAFNLKLVEEFAERKHNYQFAS